MLPLKVLGENPSLFLSVSGGPSTLGLLRHNSNLSLGLPVATFSVCLSLHLPFS